LAYACGGKLEVLVVGVARVGDLQVERGKIETEVDRCARSRSATRERVGGIGGVASQSEGEARNGGNQAKRHSENNKRATTEWYERQRGGEKEKEPAGSEWFLRVVR
jgi:hypothetical protein